MAEEIRRTGNLIGSPEGLQFQLNLDPSDQEGLAWGQGLVLLDGEPVWFTEDAEGREIPVQWTWVDLLNFLGRWWPWLILEEDYPFPFQPLYPGYLLREAELRWQEVPEEQAEKEEDEVHRFIARHDLAEAFKGIFLPSLILLRQGNTCHISAGLRRNQVLPWPGVQGTLEELGRFLAEGVSGSSNPRAQYALDLWRRREDRKSELELDLTTGIANDLRKGFQCVDWNSMEIRAVARMSSKTVILSDQQEFLQRIAAVPRRDTPELDRLTEKLHKDFQEIGAPHNQGYWTASRLRGILGLSWNEHVEPRNYLEQWGVLIDEIQIERCPVEAVTAWGDKHGPAIILNIGSGSRAAHDFGRRATLAHEMAHLVLDRDRALPAGEVLGGRTPEYPEKRARAFAAELLLPRELAENAVREYTSLEEAALYLQKKYRVSTELLAWQINNSHAWATLGQEELTRLEQWKEGRAELG
uniref:ImmA/IrrE family metallo-endopeptidase n=1 Tax=Candidatus Electrothrix sp. TaxID=2170559 RepID=UPI004055AFD6